MTKQGSYFERLLSMVSNLWSNTNTMEESTEFFLQSILVLFTNTTKYAFFRLGGNVSDLTDLKKRIFAVEITRRWGQSIMV